MASRKIQSVLAQMQKNLECSICLEMMKNPVSTACGHQFCRFCIMEFLERKKQVPCPLCKKPVTKRGLMEREQLGAMVLNVHKLIEAYQTDTGTLFSPPRGASVSMQQSTPESIKTKPSKASIRRQSNTRQSGHTKSIERRVSKETRMLQMDVRLEGTGAHQEKSSEENPSELNVYNSLRDINGGDDSSKESSRAEEIMGVQDPNVQELLDVIETGSHGASENQAVRENDTKTKVWDSKHSQNKLKDYTLCHKMTRNLSVDTAAVTNTKNLESEKQTDINSKMIDEDLRHSGKSASSQGSSEDVISLFRTPVDVKQLKQKQIKVHNDGVINARSLRSAKTMLDGDDKDKDITKGDVVVLTPEFDDKTDICYSRPDNIKTYSKKNVIGKDSKSKVSDWLKNLPDSKCETTEILHEKLSDSVGTDLESSKRAVLRVSKGQNKVEVMGQRMKARTDMVNENCKDSLFGFGELDVKENVQGEINEQNYPPNITKNEIDASNEVIIVNLKNQDLTQYWREGHKGKPVQRKRIFKSKEVDAKRDTKSKSNKDIEMKDDTIRTGYSENNKSSLKTSENISKPETQQDLTSSTKSQPDNFESKLDNGKKLLKSKHLESDISGRDKGNSFINKYTKNVNDCIDGVSIHMRSSKSNCVNKQLKDEEKPERLLKMVYSPMDTSQNCSDPYEFQSSQKTPQKQLKGKQSRSNKSKVRNKKGRVVKVIEKPGSKKTPVSRMNGYAVIEKADGQEGSEINLDTGIGGKFQSNDLNNYEKINKDIDRTEIQIIAAEIDKAEEHDLLTSTQEVLTKMTDNEGHMTGHSKENGSKNRCSKKQVRFREPVLSDFISPGKIDIRKSCKEKEMINKEKEQSTLMSLDNKKSCSDIHGNNNQMGKELCDRKTTDILSIKERKNSSHLTKDRITVKESSCKEDEGSDDLSEDYRFHDNSSGTDDLDINPDQCDFEQPDLEKQTEDVKALPSQKKECDDPKVASISCTPDLSSLSDTPQILSEQHCKSTSARILKETMIEQVCIVEETPLIVSSIADTPQVVTGPHFKNNSARKMKGTRIQPASMSKEVVLDANLHADTEYCSENPVKVNGAGPEEKGSLVGCGNDKEVDTVKETPLIFGQEIEPDTEIHANNNSSSENPVKVNENCCKEKPEIHSYMEVNTDAVSIGQNVTVQNFHIESPEEKEYGSIASTFTAGQSDQNDKVIDDMSCETFIATKVIPADIKVAMDTEETQTPCNFYVEGELEGEEVAICGGEKNIVEPKRSLSDDQEDHTSTTANSQIGVSVLELECSSRMKSADKSNKADEESKEAKLDSDIVVASTDSDRLKNVKKKRKCFMFEDTQDEVEVGLDKCLPDHITPKRQRTVSELDTEEHFAKDENENGSRTQAEQLEEGLGNTDTNTMEILYNEQINDTAGTAEGLDVISQSSAKAENSFERERHLSGILISPNDTFHKSPENIFSIDSGMPTVDFSPEEETQCEEDNLNAQDNPSVTNTERTHVSDTQMSMSQHSTPESCKHVRQNIKVRAARGFSKRSKNNSDYSEPLVQTRDALSAGSNKVRISPGFEQDIFPVTIVANNNNKKDSNLTLSATSHHSLNTPTKVNILKYKVPVAGMRPLGQGPSSVKNSPQVSPSASSFIKVSKYSPGLHRIPKSSRSPCNRDRLVGNIVEVVEVTRKDVKRMDDAVKKNDTDRKVNAKSEARKKESYNDNKIYEKEIHHSTTISTEPVFIDSRKDLNRYEDCSLSKENVSKKRSPKLCLQLGSQEKQKMVEEISTTQHKESLELLDETDQQGESFKELRVSKLLLDRNKSANEENKYSDSDNRGKKGGTIDLENNDDEIYEEVEESDGKGKNEIEPESCPLHNDVDNESEDLTSSPYLVIEDDVIKNLTCPETFYKAEEKVREKQNDLPTLSKNQADDDMYKSLDLSLDDDDSSDGDIQVELCKQTREISKFSVDMDEMEAEVIEESDVDEDQGELEGDQDEIRSVKRLRPKRAILSDSDNNSEDGSLHLDCTSSSAFSSQSENLATQEREKLEKDLEKMAAEMALLKEQLKKNQDRNDTKNDVVVLDDDEEEMIQMDDSDKEMPEEPCLSPPPFSPDMLSQEKSRDCVLLQDSATEDIGPANKKADTYCTENAPIRGSDGTEKTPIRKPLTDIDVNVIREKTNQDLGPDTPTISKKRSGFVATGLSSFQVMEVKKMASVSDVQFYSKMTPSVSHVIVKSDENDHRMCDRTLKFFQGIAQKCWLVNYQWILDSKEAGYLLPETEYEILGDTTTGCIHEGPKKSRLSKGGLFNGIKFALFGDNKYLNKDSITELIKDCGGETVDLNQLEKFGDNNYVICCMDLDEEGKKEKKQVVARSEELKNRCGVVTLKRDWIMDSVTTYELQPIKLYTVSSEQD